MIEVKNAEFLAARQLVLLSVYCHELVAEVRAGNCTKQDATDAAYKTAQWNGLVEGVGDDAVQATISAVFVGTFL